MSEGLNAELKQHFLGTHFFNPVRYMKLLEIIPGEDTLPEVLAFMADYGERVLGKGIVWAKDTPNFVGNRIGVQGMVKTMQLMRDDGLTIAEVDEIVDTGALDPDCVHLSGAFVDHIVVTQSERRIEQRTVSAG